MSSIVQMDVVDLVALASTALTQVEPHVPTGCHLQHERRVELATDHVAGLGLNVYFDQVMAAVQQAIGPCPCATCQAAQGNAAAICAQR